MSVLVAATLAFALYKVTVQENIVLFVSSDVTFPSMVEDVTGATPKWINRIIGIHIFIMPEPMTVCKVNVLYADNDCNKGENLF